MTTMGANRGVAAEAEMASLPGQPGGAGDEVHASRRADTGSTRGDVRAGVWLAATVGLTISAFVLAVAFAPRPSASPATGLAWLLFIGSSVHVAATGWLYTIPEVRRYILGRPTRYIWVPCGLISGCMVLAGLLPASIFVWILLPYFGWQLFHFQKQNLGIASLAAASHRIARLGSTERRAIVVAGIAGILGLAAHAGLLGLKLGSRLSLLAAPAALVFTVAVFLGLLALLRRPGKDRPSVFCLSYLMSLLFPLPVFVFSSPYAALGGMTIAHGLQYLLLVGLVAAGSGNRRPEGMLQVIFLTNLALLGGLGLAAASHLHNSDLPGRMLYGVYLGIGMSHFVVDAGLWRLRDEFPRRFLAERIPFLLPPRPSTHGPA